MKIYHAYASSRFPIYEKEHSEYESDMGLHGWMIRSLIRELPVTLPLRFVVPREAAWNALSEGYPRELMKVEIIGGRAAILDDPAAHYHGYEEARLITIEWEAVIHYRRSIECRPSECFVQ